MDESTFSHEPDDVTAGDGVATPLSDRINASATEKLVLSEKIVPASREQYRRLAAALYNGQEATGIKVIMVASAVVGEGKTLTASNLAMTLSESYQRRALLIDADLRRPSLEALFGIANTAGLSEGLMAATEAKLPVHWLSKYLAVMPAGRPNSDPMAGLTSDRMSKLLAEARDAFDWVVIDTPPVVLLPDANLLASMVDGAVLVIRADSTPHALVTKALDAIGRSRVLGVVLNGAKPEHQRDYQGYYGRYGYRGYYGGGRAAS